MDHDGEHVVLSKDPKVKISEVRFPSVQKEKTHITEEKPHSLCPIQKLIV